VPRVESTKFRSDPQDPAHMRVLPHFISTLEFDSISSDLITKSRNFVRDIRDRRFQLLEHSIGYQIMVQTGIIGRPKPTTISSAQIKTSTPANIATSTEGSSTANNSAQAEAITPTGTATAGENISIAEGLAHTSAQTPTDTTKQSDTS
ncbi:MAG: hypothetical protein Q9180_004673, partial [Flavoplaca navasiana]